MNDSRHNPNLVYAGWMNDDHWFIEEPVDKFGFGFGPYLGSKPKRYSVPKSAKLTREENAAIKRHEEAKQ